MPWGKLVKYLNGIAQFPFEVRLVGDQMPWSNDIGWTPEDILIRGQIWSQSFYPPSFFADCPTEEDERNIPRATLEKSRRHRCLWLGVRLSSLERWILYDRDSHEFSMTPFAEDIENEAEVHNPFTDHGEHGESE